MDIIGCGLMLAGLLAGALFGGLIPTLVFILLGIMCILTKIIDEKQKEQQAQAWRANYPKYRY